MGLAIVILVASALVVRTVARLIGGWMQRKGVEIEGRRRDGPR